ncbi:hypothetical protein RB24_17650 [Herbaspirillum rubrisubalbicans]|uniref:Phage tail protein n=1 Tax=Herbaspirillum rubrisubalbicans TaxID=80842 RepID=A0ABX9BZ02_9BURK|nr:hypothetical protein RB24_17650 [Herbaspirillum rubrisubalbicans]
MVNGKFVDEDEQTGQQGSLIPAKWGNDITTEILNVQAAAGIGADEGKADQLLAAIRALIISSGTMRAYPIAGLPTQDIGPIVVKEVCEVWHWSSSAYFTGYRSPLCGRPMDGHTKMPLASEVNAVGGTLSKSAYAALWGYAQENGLVLTQANWTANIGGHYFVDVDVNNFRVPDLRNVFRRYGGTDADSLAARALGSYKTDTFKAHGHGTGYNVVSLSGLYGPNSGGTFASSASPGTTTFGAGSAETAPKHTAFNPVIHI